MLINRFIMDTNGVLYKNNYILANVYCAFNSFSNVTFACLSV